MLDKDDMNCQATDGTHTCTLHRGHKGTHYDSLEDVSFVDTFPCPPPVVVCPQCELPSYECECHCEACGEHPWECRCVEEESEPGFGDEVDYVWGVGD